LDINAAKATNTPDLSGSVVAPPPHAGGTVNEQLRLLLHQQQVILQQQHPCYTITARMYTRISLDNSASQTSEKPDISKYTQLLDSTANTLKFR
jgi:hypothetical protein